MISTPTQEVLRTQHFPDDKIQKAKIAYTEVRSQYKRNGAMTEWGIHFRAAAALAKNNAIPIDEAFELVSEISGRKLQMNAQEPQVHPGKDADKNEGRKTSVGGAQRLMDSRSRLSSNSAMERQRASLLGAEIARGRGRTRENPVVRLEAIVGPALALLILIVVLYYLGTFINPFGIPSGSSTDGSNPDQVEPTDVEETLMTIATMLENGQIEVREVIAIANQEGDLVSFMLEQLRTGTITEAQLAEFADIALAEGKITQVEYEAMVGVGGTGGELTESPQVVATFTPEVTVTPDGLIAAVLRDGSRIVFDEQILNNIPDTQSLEGSWTEDGVLVQTRYVNGFIVRIGVDAERLDATGGQLRYETFDVLVKVDGTWQQYTIIGWFMDDFKVTLSDNGGKEIITDFVDYMDPATKDNELIDGDQMEITGSDRILRVGNLVRLQEILGNEPGALSTQASYDDVMHKKHIMAFHMIGFPDLFLN